MGEWIPPRTWVTGETVTAAAWTTISTNLRELKDREHVHCYHSQDEEIKDSEWEVLRWDSDVLDNQGMHENFRTKQYGSPASSSKFGSRDGRWPDTSSKRSARVTAGDDACYLVIFKVQFAADATGNRKVMVRKNSNETPGAGHPVGTWMVDATSSGPTNVWAEVPVMLERGDHIEIFAYQSSGGLLTVNAGKDTTFLQVAQVTS